MPRFRKEEEEEEEEDDDDDDDDAYFVFIRSWSRVQVLKKKI